MRMLLEEERELLLMPRADLPPSREATESEHRTANALVEFHRARWDWTVNPGGIEYQILEDTEWTERALRVDALVRQFGG